MKIRLIRLTAILTKTTTIYEANDNNDTRKFYTLIGNSHSTWSSSQPLSSLVHLSPCATASHSPDFPKTISQHTKSNAHRGIVYEEGCSQCITMLDYILYLTTNDTKRWECYPQGPIPPIPNACGGYVPGCIIGFMNGENGIPLLIPIGPPTGGNLPLQ